MAIYSFQELQEKISKCNTDDLYIRICKNTKRIRKEKYKEFTRNYTNSTINPYTTIKDLKVIMILLKKFH